MPPLPSWVAASGRLLAPGLLFALPAVVGRSAHTVGGFLSRRDDRSSRLAGESDWRTVRGRSGTARLVVAQRGNNESESMRERRRRWQSGSLRRQVPCIAIRGAMSSQPEEPTNDRGHIADLLRAKCYNLVFSGARSASCGTVLGIRTTGPRTPCSVSAARTGSPRALEGSRRGAHSKSFRDCPALGLQRNGAPVSVGFGDLQADRCKVPEVRPKSSVEKTRRRPHQ